MQSYGAEQSGTLGYTMKRLKQSLNLNEFSLNLDTTDPFMTTSGQEDSYTSIQMGKQLSSRLYVRTDIGMPVGSLTLIYQLAKRWSLQANGTYGWSHEAHPLDTGADLFYNF